MKLISLNIEAGLHNKLVLPFLKKEKPDVICFQEFLEEDFELYKKKLGLEGIYQTWSYWNNKKNYPQLAGKKQGVAIFAKNIVNSGFIFFAGKEENILKSFKDYSSNEDFQKNKALVWADIRGVNGIVYRFISVQLPVTNKGESTPYQLEVIDSLLRKVAPFEEFVLCGDMNAPRGSKSFNRLEKNYKNNIPLKYKTSIDQNLHRVKGIQLVVDHLFTTPLYKASKVRLVDGVSDHMAVIAEIQKIKTKQNKK